MYLTGIILLAFSTFCAIYLGILSLHNRTEPFTEPSFVDFAKARIKELDRQNTLMLLTIPCGVTAIIGDTLLWLAP